MLWRSTQNTNILGMMMGEVKSQKGLMIETHVQL